MTGNWKEPFGPVSMTIRSSASGVSALNKRSKVVRLHDGHGAHQRTVVGQDVLAVDDGVDEDLGQVDCLGGVVPRVTLAEKCLGWQGR